MDKAPHPVSMVVLNGELVVLCACGKLHRRMQDPRSFATGPNHKAAFLWEDIKGPHED